MNLVMTGSGKFVEVQATGERAAFDDDQLTQLIRTARNGILELIEHARRSSGLVMCTAPRRIAAN